jgi:hypothetical protein
MDLGHAEWRKSSRSGGGDCVEIAHLPGVVAVRDSKNPGGVLTFPDTVWERVATRWSATS